MRRFLPLLVLLAFAGCGKGTTTHTATTTSTQQQTTSCDPALGKGTMGVCTPEAPPDTRVQLEHGATLIPDVSEFQSCALHSEAIFRVYEAGLEREDTAAGCHARELKRLHAWSAAYAFLRAGHGGCVVQADRTVAIVERLGGVVGPVIGDAEIGLAGGFVRCFLHEVERLGYPAVEYTCPGCGDEQRPPIWIAAYPNRPPGKWVAHQFSDRFPCRGVFGDCSVDEGVLAIRAHHVDRHQLEQELRGHERLRDKLRAQIGHLHTKLDRHGCTRARHLHHRLTKQCAGWFGAGDRVHAHGKLEDRFIARIKHELAVRA